MEQAKKLVEGIIKGNVSYLEGELKKIKKGLYNFSLSTNVYQNKAYKNKENDVKNMLNKLENYSVQNNATQPSKGLFRPEIVIPVVLLVALTMVAVVIVRRRKNTEK